MTVMKKVYKLIDLDCANCAAKMENSIKDLPEVEDCTVSFLTQKMTLRVPDGTDMDALMDKVVKLCKKVEPDCQIVL